MNPHSSAQQHENPAGVKPIPPTAKKMFSGVVYDVWQWEQEMFDGSRATYERLVRTDYAFCIGVMANNNIMLVTDEQPDRGNVITPAGGGVGEKETPKQAAQRELLEETGYTARELIPWFNYRPSSRIDFLAHAFIAKGLKKETEPKLEPGEKINTLIYSFDEFLKLGSNPLLRDWMVRIKLLEAQTSFEKKEELKQLLYE